MDALLAEAANLWRATFSGDDLRLIGGLAVRLHVGSSSRTTTDIDLVAMNQAARERLLEHLERSGYQIVHTGGWWRAMRNEGRCLVIDVADNPVVNPRTFEPVHLRAAPRSGLVGDIPIAAAGVDDLVMLKLLAMRDQDLADLLLLSGACDISAKAIAHVAEDDDVERTVAAGAIQARHALSSGRLEDIIEELLERKPDERSVSRLVALLAALEEEGL